MNTFISLFCIIAVILFIMALGYFSNRSNKKKAKVRDSATRPPNKKTGWQSLLLPLGFALILFAWSPAFALFFLVIVWIMRLNPKADSNEIPFPSDKDRKRAKGTYLWLLISALPNVLIFAFIVSNLARNPTPNERAIAALIPLFIHLPVLFRLDSKSPFVFRHTQQAVFLLALRASTATLALNISKYPDDGIWLFFIANGFLWLFGSFWGRAQAHKGKGWWIKRKGEIVLSKDAVPESTATPRNDELDKLIDSLGAEGSTPRQKALNAFRQGSEETRKKAVLILTQLGEVEKF